MKMKNMSHMMWIPYSLTFLCKKPFTILSIKFTQKRNFPKSAIKQLSRLLIKVTTECLFQLKQKLYKQAEGCSMGGPLSVTLADIHMIWTENDAVKPLKPLFYKRFVYDIYSHCKRIALISYIMNWLITIQI